VGKFISFGIKTISTANKRKLTYTIAAGRSSYKLYTILNFSGYPLFFSWGLSNTLNWRKSSAHGLLSLEKITDYYTYHFMRFGKAGFI
jgi:hypothetical protein